MRIEETQQNIFKYTPTKSKKTPPFLRSYEHKKPLYYIYLKQEDKK